MGRISIFYCLGIGLWCLYAFINAEEQRTVWLIGDSTMAAKAPEKYPETGWGVPFSKFFNKSIKVENHAQNGRSTKSFIAEGRWKSVYRQLKNGDYVFIQFGHNDEKVEKPEVGTSLAVFKDNLAKMVDETRRKQAIPVLLTPIARRNFVNGKLQDTHGGYPAAMRTVADSLDVALIDMTKKSEKLLSTMGDIMSKQFFLHLPAGDSLYPEGVEDNTHLNVKGAEAIASLVLEGMIALKLDLISAAKSIITVAQDGSGTYRTVQEALEAVPDHQSNTTTILIKPGIYHERLIVKASKSHVKLLGEDPLRTILTYDNFASKIDSSSGEKYGTTGSSSFFVYGSDFTAENISFVNASGPVGQAVAVNITGNRVAFRNCRFLGFQDTLYVKGPQDDETNQSLQYFEACYIEGTVDFIFGAATALFVNCELHSKGAGYVTAASTPEDKAYGFVFMDCQLTGDAKPETVALGRPWRPYAKVVYLDCRMESHIRREGWDNWNKKENESTAFFAEYGSKGPGGRRRDRLPWTKQLHTEEASKFTKQAILQGWEPRFATRD